MYKHDYYSNLSNLCMKIASTEIETIMENPDIYCIQIESIISNITDDLKNLSDALNEIIQCESPGLSNLESYTEDDNMLITMMSKHIIDEYLETGKINQKYLVQATNHYYQLLNLLFVILNYRLDKVH